MEEYTGTLALAAVQIGHRGIGKQIFVGVREHERDIDYLRAFVEQAHAYNEGAA